MSVTETTTLLTGITAVIAIIVSLINASSTASKTSFEQLQKVVEEVRADLASTRKELEVTKKDLNEERQMRIRYERWARVLDSLLTQHKITHISLDEVELEE